MAQAAAPKGFIPVRHFDGSPWNGAVATYICTTNDATAIFVGDLVVKEATIGAGPAGLQIFGQNAEGLPTCILASAATTGQNIVGVVTGFSPDPTNLMNRYRLASTARLVYVCVDPTVIYECQEDGVGNNITAAMIGDNFAYTTTAGNTTTGVSKQAIDSSTNAVTATLPLKVLGLSRRVGNAFGLSTTDLAVFDVTLNTTAYAKNTLGS
ncbi:MAG: hypothetical protein ACYC9R_06400 [Nitrosotalea sp.]